MAAYGRPSLRDLFDESPTPHIAHPPRTHHRDFYIASDGSFSDAGGGLGVIIETRDGERVVRRSLPDDVPNNNVAEYRALHLGLDILSARAPRDTRVGVLIDHDNLAANVNRATIAAKQPSIGPPHPFQVPGLSQHHWRGIRARIAGFQELRAARIDSSENPAHPLANTPKQYAHVNQEPDRCVLPSQPVDTDPTGQFPPPSRANRPRHASD
ncbi:ribonuclease H family protein [Halocatena pleomorpha]|uniref:Ribonuclease H n=1 Tax=Halocatena pleomorpha TaxID=1785090 RepID=A0A3P3RFK1_9EURY|nr:ribonuclease H [Halocatena pleomorpha]RRJ31698.1 ribonuclease H [Halocatena pleomorpha]